MKYLIHYSYECLGDKHYDWAWTKEDATPKDLQKLIDSIRASSNMDYDTLVFHGIYNASNIIDIRYSSDGSLKE
jgi:hypothetical protein